MTALAVACKGCGCLVATGIRTGWVNHPVLGTHAFPCASCGFRATYSGADFVPAAG